MALSSPGVGHLPGGPDGVAVSGRRCFPGFCGRCGPGAGTHHGHGPVPWHHFPAGLCPGHGAAGGHFRGLLRLRRNYRQSHQHTGNPGGRRDLPGWLRADQAGAGPGSGGIFHFRFRGGHPGRNGADFPDSALCHQYRPEIRRLGNLPVLRVRFADLRLHFPAAAAAGAGLRRWPGA